MANWCGYAVLLETRSGQSEILCCRTDRDHGTSDATDVGLPWGEIARVSVLQSDPQLSVIFAPMLSLRASAAFPSNDHHRGGVARLQIP